MGHADMLAIIWLGWAVWILAALYLGLGVAVILGVRRAGARNVAVPKGWHPFVSILVATRNEEETIEACLGSLLMQDYPPDAYEVVVVNDRSTDETRPRMEPFLGKTPQVRIVDVVDDPVRRTGKHNALDVGIHHCRGQIILHTDADCIVPPTWIAAMVRHFADDVGVVVGVPVTHHRGGRASLFARIQALDLAYSLNLAVGTVGLDIPATCMGNNLAYRRGALDEVGGYAAMDYTVTEDAQLLQMIHSRTKWRVAVAQEPEATVFTRPAPTLRDFYWQRARWLIGGIATHARAIQYLRLALLYQVILLLSPALIWWFPVLTPPLVCAWVVRALCDCAVAWQGTSRIGRRDLMAVFFPFAVYLLIYTSVMGLAAGVVRGVRWKGVNYGRHA